MEENTTGKKYELIFELFGKGREYAILRKKIKDTAEQFKPCTPVLKTVHGNRLQITVEGALEDIDRCHFLLRSEYFNGVEAICKRDEAGDQLRHNAFPLLADIEHRVRLFIQRIMTESGGVQWWEELVQGAYQKKVETFRKKQREGYYEHPLENLDFGDLIELTQHRFTFWNKGEEEIAKELTGAVAKASDIDDLKKRVTEILKPRSVWDDIFALYFVDQNEFDTLRGKLSQVIYERNKVMHHRAISLDCYQKLIINSTAVCTTLDKKIEKLNSAKERELKESMDALTKAVTQPFAWSPQDFSLSSYLLSSKTFPWDNPSNSLAAQLISSTTFNATLNESLAAQFLTPIADVTRRFSEEQAAMAEELSRNLNSVNFGVNDVALRIAEDFSRNIRELSSGISETYRRIATELNDPRQSYFDGLGASKTEQESDGPTDEDFRHDDDEKENE